MVHVIQQDTYWQRCWESFARQDGYDFQYEHCSSHKGSEKLAALSKATQPATNRAQSRIPEHPIFSLAHPVARPSIHLVTNPCQARVLLPAPQHRSQGQEGYTGSLIHITGSQLHISMPPQWACPVRVAAQYTEVQNRSK